MLEFAVRNFAAACLLSASAMSQISVTLRVVDQDNHEIPGSAVEVLGNSYTTGTVANLPPGTADFTLIPGVAGAYSFGRLARVESATVTSTTTSLTFAWAIRSVLLHVHDQNGVDMVGSQFGIYASNQVVANGSIVTLPVND